MLLNYIELNNFRAVRHGRFEPDALGITGLFGHNGVGKSAFMDGLLWALFGNLPESATQSELRNIKAPAKEGCYVEVEFVSNGDTFKVRRELRGGKNITAVMNTWRNGDKVTDRSVKVGQKFIEDEVLQMNAEIFTTAILVGQKQLDSLVSSKPAQRRALIESLAGIDRLTNALKLAREDANRSKATAHGSTGSEEDVTEAQTTYETRVEEAQELFTQTEQALAYMNETKDKYEELNTIREEHISKERTVQSLTNELDRANAALENITTGLLGTQELVTSTSAGLGDINEIIAEHENVKTEREGLLKKISDLETQITEITETGANVSATIRHLEAGIENNKSVEEGLQKRIEMLSQVEDVPEDTINAINAKLDELRDKDSNLKAHIHLEKEKIEALRKNISVIEKSHQAECPTCKSEIENPDVLIGILKQNITDSQNLVEELYKENENIITIGKKTAQERDALLEASKEYANAVTGLNNAKKELEASIISRTEGIQRLESLQKEAQSHREAYTKLIEERKALSERVESLSATFATLSSAMARVNELRAAQERVASLEESRDEQKIVVAEIQNALEQAQAEFPSQDEISQNIEAVKIALDAYESAQATYRELESDSLVAKNDIAHLKRSLDNYQALFNHKQVLLEEYSTKEASSKVIEEFRKEQISRLAPELAEVATNLINYMTGGFYVGVELDENFTPTLIRSDGEERPLSWLSGGEKSLVSLSLRIAISDLISGYQGGLLLLDEVLTAQDASRREYTVQTLRSLPNRQIVMISHTQGTNDIVDKSILLVSTDDGTKIEESSSGIGL